MNAKFSRSLLNIDEARRKDAQDFRRMSRIWRFFFGAVVAVYAAGYILLYVLFRG